MLCLILSKNLKVRELSLNLHRILLDTVKMQEFQDVRLNMLCSQPHVHNVYIILSFLGSGDAYGFDVQNFKRLPRLTRSPLDLASTHGRQAHLSKSNFKKHNGSYVYFPTFPSSLS